MLRTLFQWFDGHPESYWLIAAVPSALWLFLALFPALKPDSKKSSPGSELIFAFLLLATLVAWRWPFWLNADPYNPDESQFIAGAITLTRDPIFWKSVDGTTSGPLNFYVLLPLHWLGAPLDYFSARVTGVLLVWAAILGCHRLVRSLYGSAPARLSVLPITAFFVAVTDADFLHYSSEHVPLALIAISASYLFTRSPSAQRRGLWWLGALAAGALPWAKLQTTPIAATLIGIGLWALWKDPENPPGNRVRLAVELVIAAVIPSVVIIAVVGASGHIPDLYRDYLLQNISYLDQKWSLAFALRKLWAFSFETGNLPVYVGMAVSVVILAATLHQTATKKHFAAAGILTLVATLCVIAPKRPFFHYTLLIIVPLSIWLGLSIGELWQAQARSPRWKSLTTTVATVAFLAIIGVRLTHGVPNMFGRFSEHWRHPRSAVGNIVHALTSSRDRLAVWGWMERFYVDSGLPQATRESKSFQQITPSRQREHYRDRYVTDLKKNLPPVFIDATGPGAPVFDDRGTAAHETVPALGELVQTHYRLLTDLGYARIYVRPERLAEHPISASELWRLITNVRHDEDLPGPVSVLPKRLIRKKIQGRMVQMMLPPAEMVWELDGTEREVFLEYGYDPRAYQEGRSNGAEVIAELQKPGSAPRPLFKRSLDPAKRIDERGNLVSRIVLPPFPPGTRFIVRTTPGEFGDNAWDWVYVGPLGRARAPFYSPSQFPGFSRTPDFVESEHAFFIDDAEGKLLMTHAPSMLRFSLKGNERRWQFDYGFQPGAYTGEGQTDGATFIVEWQRPGQPATTLFSHTLDPVRVIADQGRLHADLVLPGIQPGDQLVMRIDPGPSLAWDWTYIAQVQIDENLP